MEEACLKPSKTRLGLMECQGSGELHCDKLRLPLGLGVIVGGKDSFALLFPKKSQDHSGYLQLDLGQVYPRRVNMFIALDTVFSPAPFGGAELNLAGTRLASFRPSERRRHLSRLSL